MLYGGPIVSKGVLTMKRLLLISLLMLGLAVGGFAQATQGPTLPGAVPTVQPVERADAATNVQHSHSSAATITLTAGAAGSNTQSIYITGIDITNCMDATGATPAAQTFITTTGINGSPQYQLGSGNTNAAFLGTCIPTSVIPFTAPVKNSAPGTNVTFVLPTFATHQTVSVNVYFRLGY
jgi:hypothetical protein